MKNEENQVIDFKSLPTKEKTKVRVSYILVGAGIGLGIGLLFSLWQMRYLDK